MSEQKYTTSSRSLQWKWMMFAMLLLLGAFAVLWLLGQQNEQVTVEGTGKSLPVVSVVEVAPDAHRVRISVLSEAKARNIAELRTQAAGQIVSLGENFLPGRKIQRGTILLQIQNDAQKTMVAEAENRLAQAKLALLTEERMAVIAQTNWKLSSNGEEVASSLVLRKPQLESARAELKAAAATLAEAESQLRNTAVRVPFHGVIDRRDVSLGETVDIGQAIGLVVDQETIDITVHLNNHDWLLLPDKLESIGVSLSDPFSDQTWSASVRARSGVVDESTRLRRLYLVHKRDSGNKAPLLPGTYVKVLIEGVVVENALKVPESAFTRDGSIWSVGEDDRLVRYEAKRIFSRDGSVFVSISGLTNNDTFRIAQHPLTGFVVGERVEARVVEVSE